MDYPRGIVHEVFFESAALDEKVRLLIHLPATFSYLYKYSLLIAQDGDDYFRLGRVGSQADELLAKKEIENLIIVGVPYNDVDDRREKYHPNGSKHAAYLRFLAHELIPYLDRSYPTYQMGATRALAGDSLAGTVSLLAALAYPHTFGKALIQSPYVNDAVIEASASYNGNPPLSIYHSIGKKETEVEMTDGKTGDFLKPNRELSRILTKKPVTYFYKEFDGGHFWTFWQPQLKDALKALF